MRRQRHARTWRRRLAVAPVAVLLAVTSMAAGTVAAAAAEQGTSTPGAIITAQNPGTSPAGSDLRITLTAHSAAGSGTDLSCRPQDQTLRCWASLVLDVPEAGGLRLTGFQAHRVAIGVGECSGCGGDVVPASANATVGPSEAVVNGLATVQRPGSTDLATGATVQVKIALVDEGAARYRDQVDVAVYRYVEGSVKPLVYDSQWQVVEQVAIKVRGGG